MSRNAVNSMISTCGLSAINDIDKQPSIFNNNEQDGFDLKVNQVLKSEVNEFVVLDFLGEGTYGKVIKCRMVRTNELVAIKMLKANSQFTNEGDREIIVLRALAQANAEQHSVVRFFGSFFHQTHKCIVFEALEKSLADYLKRTHHKPIEMNNIRTVISQVLVALFKLNSFGILHCDLKPHNIMLVDNERSPFAVKLIDFGSVCPILDIKRYSTVPCMQTLWYRSPEIILGLPFSPAIDMWSLGCVAVELFTGSVLYPSASEYDAKRMITQFQGLLPSQFLDIGQKTKNFFICDKVIGASVPVWRLKLHHELQIEVKTNEERTYKLGGMHLLEKLNLPRNLTHNQLDVELRDRKEFVRMIHGMLELEQGRRISVQAALSLPFVTVAPQTESLRTTSVVNNTGRPASSVTCMKEPTMNTENAQRGHAVMTNAQAPAWAHKGKAGTHALGAHPVTMSSHSSKLRTQIPPAQFPAFGTNQNGSVLRDQNQGWGYRRN